MNDSVIMRENIRAFIRERKKTRTPRLLSVFVDDVFSEYPEEIRKEEMIREGILQEEKQQ